MLYATNLLVQIDIFSKVYSVWFANMFPLYLLFSVYIYGDITGNSLVFYDTRAVVTYQQGAASEYRGCFGVGKHTRVIEQAISIYITSSVL